MAQIPPPTLQLAIGIRAEDKNKWERRVPLTPAAVRTLVDAAYKVFVQPSSNRIFADAEFERVGAILQSDLSDASLILAVKEVPITKLLANKAYAFFSHTIKAQPANMPLLDAVLEKRIRLFDYECLTVMGERGGHRLVAFGRFAGLAGIIDFFSGMGSRYLTLGYSTPFLAIGRTYMYPTLAHALAAVKEAGDSIVRNGLPDALSPCIVGITGDGNVAGGAREVVAALGPCVRWVQPGELAGIRSNAKGRDRTHVVYATVITAQHMVRRMDGSPFDKNHYKSRPEEYTPVFHSDIAPHLSLLGVCHFWDHRFPRILTVQDTRALAAAGQLRMHGICDISADFMGSVEFCREFRPIESPFFMYEPLTDEISHDLDAPAGHILYHCVDHLPSECAREASEHFSSCLLSFIPGMLASCTDMSRSLSSPDHAASADIAAEVVGACVAECGKLAPNFDYIASLRAARERAESAALARATLPTHVQQASASTASLTDDVLANGQAGSGLRIHPPSQVASPVLLPARVSSFLSLHARGHLFDSGWVNQGLDVCESHGVDAAITSVSVGKDKHTRTRMSLVLAVRSGTASPNNTLATVVHKLKELAKGKTIDLTVDVDERRAAASGISAMASGLANAHGASAALGMGGSGVLGSPDVTDTALQTGTGTQEDDASAVGMFLGSETPKTGVGYPTSRPKATIPLMALSPSVAALLHRSSTPKGQEVRVRHGLALPQKRVLMLGAGLVAGPALRTLLKQSGVRVTVASVLETEAYALMHRYGSTPSAGSIAVPLVLDASKDAMGLLHAVRSADVVLSLLPAPLHPNVARACVEAKVHMVTASYVSPELASFDAAAKEAGIIMLHEMGLDPGIDHISARAMIEAVHARGGTVTSFTSLCGGLSAPEDCMDNLLGYKFSWSPRGALVAMQNDALYLREGVEVKVAGKDLLAAAEPIRLGPGFALEVLPNRDSMPYAKKYGLEGPSLRNMKRGTLRFEGFSARMRAFGALGFLSALPLPIPTQIVTTLNSKTLVVAPALVAHLLNQNAGDGSPEAIRVGLLALFGQDVKRMEDAMQLLAWANLLDSATHLALVLSPTDSTMWLPVDTLAAHLSSLPSMSFRLGERDMCVLHHELEASFPAASSARQALVERHTATLVQFGERLANDGSGVTAMSTTVGVTAAIGVQLVLNGLLNSSSQTLSGVHAPVHAAIVKPALERLAQEGIVMKESMKVLSA